MLIVTYSLINLLTYLLNLEFETVNDIRGSLCSFEPLTFRPPVPESSTSRSRSLK